MYQPIRPNTKTPSVKNSIDRSPVQYRLFLIAIGVACFMLSPTLRAVSPPPDGGYPNGNTAEGENALFSLTSGYDNTAIGFQALLNNTNPNGNTAIGSNALANNFNGGFNTATGDGALFSNLIGYYNTANGAFFALEGNTTGSFNTANGFATLFSNTTGDGNTANGYEALINNTTGRSNTANGFMRSLTTQPAASTRPLVTKRSIAIHPAATTQPLGVRALGGGSGSFNTATGVDALSNNTTAYHNTATGYQALFTNTTGIQNTANGAGALSRNTTGNGNVAEGIGALQNNTGSFNVAIGYNAGVSLTTGRDNIDISAAGAAGESNTIRIGNTKQTATFVGGIRGITTGNANAVPVLIDSAGQLGTASSSCRFKHEIKPMDKTSEAIFTLKPVTFQYKSDRTATPQFGLIAEEVAAVNPNLVVRDENGEIYTVRYEAVNAMLLNEFLKEHRHVQEQDAIITRQQRQIEALTAGLLKVSAQLK